VVIAGLVFLLVAALAGTLRALARDGLLTLAFDYTRLELLELSGRAGLVTRNLFAEGRNRTREADIVAVLDPYRGRLLLEVHPEDVQERLEALPWVRTATVFRQLPDTLVARVVEHRPMALWYDGTRYRLVGRDGEFVPVNDMSPFRRLPRLAGDGAPGRARELFDVLAQEPALAQRVTQAVLIGKRRWNVWFDRQIEVRLPEAGLEEAWRYLGRRQRETSLLARAIEAIDLRNPNWLVVRLIDDQQEVTSGRGA
jgi:cell division protein FtsQ